MKCFNKGIFSKLIFSFKVLMYCSRKNVACFLCLLVILKCALDLFHGGTNIMNPEQTATDATVRLVREKDFNLHLCTKNRNYIQSIESDCRNKGESLSFAHSYLDA